MLQAIRQIAIWSLASLLSLPLLAPGSAFAYPDQPIKIIVTFPPGGSADIVIRALQPLLAEDLRQPIVIENRAGAGGNIGIGSGRPGRPDGYTLGVAAAGVLTVNPHLNRAAMPFDPGRIWRRSRCLPKFRSCWWRRSNQVSPRSRTSIAAAKTRPATLSIGHGGNGTAMHLTSALFNQKAGVEHSAGRLSRHRAGHGRCSRRTYPAAPCWISPHHGN